MRCKARKLDGDRCGLVAGASGMCTTHRVGGPTGVERQLRHRGLYELVDHVALAYGCSVDMLCGNRRTKAASAARQEVWRQLRATTSLSYPEIGRLFNRDHSTVISGVRAAEDSIRASKLRIEVERRTG